MWNRKKTTTITIVNDSSHEISVDSIKIILLEGSILGEIEFAFISFLGSHYRTGFYSNILPENDTTFSLEQYEKEIINYDSRKLKISADSQRVVEWFQIGSGLGNSIVSDALSKQLQSTSFKVGDEYEIKFVLYSNDNTEGSVVIRGNNVIIDSTPVRHPIKNKFMPSCRITRNGFTDLLGRCGAQATLNTASSIFYMIATTDNTIISRINLKK